LQRQSGNQQRIKDAISKPLLPKNDDIDFSDTPLVLDWSKAEIQASSSDRRNLNKKFLIPKGSDRSLRFHSKTFELLGREPEHSNDSAKLLDQVEKRIGNSLPPSVREWYEIEGACQILKQYSNCDRPLEIAELGEPCGDTSDGGPHDLLTRNLLLFKWENQGVCAWAINLDGSDDPPVVVDVDTQFRKWQHCADSFSQYVHTCVWDYALVMQSAPSDSLLVQAQNQPLSEHALDFLRANFQSELMTYGWPGQSQYRFFDGDQRILIWAGQDQADWHLIADNEESLGRLITRVAPFDSLASSLWSHAKEGTALLKKILS
jgi:hypothetical protein